MINFNVWSNPSSSPFFYPFHYSQQNESPNSTWCQSRQNEEMAHWMPCSSRLKGLNVDKEAQEAADKPAKQPKIFLSMHKPAPSSVPSLSASLSKLHSSPTNNLILLFVRPHIQVVKKSSAMSQRRIKFAFVQDIGETLEEGCSLGIKEENEDHEGEEGGIIGETCSGV